jgi:hypothetical protein
MSARRNFTEQDYDLLSAYIDGALTETERAALETRLSAEPELRRELDALRQNVVLLRGLPPMKAPRNFTLTPAMVRPSRWLIFPTTAAFSAISAAAAMLLLLFGATLLFNQGSQAVLPNTVSQFAAEQESQVAVNPTLAQATTVDNEDAAFTATASDIPPEPLEQVEREQTTGTDVLPAPTQATGDSGGGEADLFSASASPALAGTPTLDAALSMQSAAEEPPAEENAQTEFPPPAGIIPLPQATIVGATFAPTGVMLEYAPADVANGAAAADQSAETVLAATASPAPTQTRQMTATTTPSATATPTVTVTPTATITPTATPTPGVIAQVTSSDLLPLLLLGLGGLLLVVAIITTWIRRRGG